MPLFACLFFIFFLWFFLFVGIFSFFCFRMTGVNPTADSQVPGPQGDGGVVESSEVLCALGRAVGRQGAALPDSQCPAQSLTWPIPGWHQGGCLALESGGGISFGINVEN